MIGLDYSDCHRSLREIHGKSGEPIARLTLLGWICVGAVTDTVENRTFSTKFIQIQDSSIDQTLRQYWEIERFNESNNVLSQNEQKALKLAEQLIIEKENFYSVPIPWKDNKDSLKNNYQMTLDRLKSTEKKLKRDPEMFERYSNTIEQYVKISTSKGVN